jgi:hypothetical protein
MLRMTWPSLMCRGHEPSRSGQCTVNDSSSVWCPSGVRQTTENDQERPEWTIGEIPCPVWDSCRKASDLKTLVLPSHGRGHWPDPSGAHHRNPLQGLTIPGFCLHRHDVRTGWCPSKLRLGADRDPPWRPGRPLVEVSVDVENGPGALVSEPLGDVSGGLVLGDEHRYVGCGGGREECTDCRLVLRRLDSTVGGGTL